MMVFALPNFEVDKRADKAAELVYCTTLQPVTIDYLATVAHHFGGGHYLFELYEPGKGIVKRWHEGIKKAIVEPPPSAVAVPVAEVQKSGTPKSEIKRLREVAEDLREIKEIMGWDAPPPVAVAAPVAAPSAVSSLDELLLKAAMDKPELSDKILNRLLGPSDDGGGGFVAEIFKHPTEARALLNDFLREVRSIFAPAGAHTNGNGAPASQPGAAAPNEALNPLEKTLRIVINDLKKNRRPGRAADAIDDLLSQDPSLKDSLNGIFDSEPAALITQLSEYAKENLHEYGHAPVFITNLKAELRPAQPVEDEE
jgi:hypothetical protein